MLRHAVIHSSKPISFGSVAKYNHQSIPPYSVSRGDFKGQKTNCKTPQKKENEILRLLSLLIDE